MSGQTWCDISNKTKRRRIRGTSEILEGMQKVRRTRVWRKTGQKMLPRMCLCVCIVCVPLHFRSYFRCKEKLPCVCVCVCVCKGNPPPFNCKKGSSSGPSQLTDGCSPCGKCLLFQGRRHQGFSVLCHFRQVRPVQRAGVCVCVCARRISLVAHEKEPRLTVVHTLQENTFLFPVIEP